jgi:hypothetical protein
MKNILVFLLMCTIGFTYAQTETDTLYNEEDWTYTYLVYPNRYEYVSVDELKMTLDLYKSKRMTYKPFIDIYVHDTINKIRISKGLSPILYDTLKIDEDLFDKQMYFAQAYTKEYGKPIYLEKNENPSTECDCVTSITEDLFDDSLILIKKNFFTGKVKKFLFRDFILNPNLKDIRILYFQTAYRNEAWESLYVYIKNKRQPYATYHYIINEEKIK